jgi:hypothetical protein
MPTIANIVEDVRKQLDEIQVNASGFLQGTDNEDLDVIIRSHISDAIRFVYERADMRYMHPTNFIDTDSGITISDIKDNIKPKPTSFLVASFDLPDSFVRLYSAKADSWDVNISDCIDWNDSNYTKLWNLYTTGYPDKPVCAIVPKNSVVIDADMSADYIFTKTAGYTPTIPSPTALGQKYFLFDNSTEGLATASVYDSYELSQGRFVWMYNQANSQSLMYGISQHFIKVLHATEQMKYYDVVWNSIFVLTEHTITYNDYTRMMMMFSLKSTAEGAFAYYVAMPSIDTSLDTNTIDIIEKVYTAVISQIAGLTLLTIRDNHADSLFNLALSQMGAKIPNDNG